MSDTSVLIDPAFIGTGRREGIVVWRIENLKPVRQARKDFGKLCRNDSYIFLLTRKRKYVF